MGLFSSGPKIDFHNGKFKCRYNGKSYEGKSFSEVAEKLKADGIKPPKEDPKLKAAATKAAGWAALPFKKVGEKGAKAFYSQKGKWVKGVCVHCGNAIGNSKQEGYAHNKCHKEAVKAVKNWQSSMEINNTNHDRYGRSKSGVRYFGCGCNANNATHGKFCKYSGNQISDSLRKGLD